jgi:hypothetical protein
MSDSQPQHHARRGALPDDPIVAVKLSSIGGAERTEVFSQIEDLAPNPSRHRRDPLADEVGDPVTRDMPRYPWAPGCAADASDRERHRGTSFDRLACRWRYVRNLGERTRKRVEHEPSGDRDPEPISVKP